MSLQSIKTALETRLKAMPNALPTQWENVAFTPPAGAYQRADLLPATPENPELFGNVYRELGTFQVTLLYPIDGGGGVVYGMAEAVRDWFARGTSLESGNVTVVVGYTPAIGPKFVDQDRFVLPVSVRYWAYIAT